jgi:large subunit ribosomal protein L7A
MTASLSPLESVRAAEARAVGASQTVKAVQRGRARLVLVARDAERKVIDPVVRAAREHGVPLVEVDSMRELGRACGIAVGAAAAAVLELPPSAERHNRASPPST